MIRIGRGNQSPQPLRVNPNIWCLGEGCGDATGGHSEGECGAWGREEAGAGSCGLRGLWDGAVFVVPGCVEKPTGGGEEVNPRPNNWTFPIK